MKVSNKKMIISAIVLLIAAVVLLSAVLIFAVSGSGNLIFDNDNNKNDIVFDKDFEAANVSDIAVYCAFGNINIKQSNTDKIRVFTNDGNEDYFSVTVKNGVMKIENKKKNQGRFKLNSIFGKRFSKNMDIDVYLPENCVKNIKINSDFGNVNVDSLNNVSLKADCAMGNIDIEYICGDFDINTDMGNVKIDRADITKNSSASSSMGDIKIKSTNDVKIDYDTSMGDCDVANNNPSSDVTLKAHTSMGDVKIG